MIVVGLTGSIGMGKSTTARMFADEGVPVYDADAEVRALYAPGGAAVPAIEAAFPGVCKDGSIDRTLLGDRVLGDEKALAQLNAIVWPLMATARAAFFERAKAANSSVVVLDIPLLLETGGEKGVDVVVVVSAAAVIQKERVMARTGMSEKKFEAIFAAQMPDREKRQRADFIIDTGEGMDAARRRVEEILSILRSRGEATH